MLGSVEQIINSDGALDDPLMDDGSLKEQLDRLPVICRFQYGSVANKIINKFDSLLNQYRQLMSLNPSSDISKQKAIIEGQLTWLTYMIGAIVGGHSWSSAHLEEGDEAIDASLSRRALQLAQALDYQLASSNGAARYDSKLEQSLLFYCQNFRRVYMFMWDQVSRLYFIYNT